MVGLYVKLVLKGARTIDEVPEKLRGAVTKKLEELEAKEE